MTTAMAPANTNNELAPELRAGAKRVFKIRLLRGRHVDRQGKWDATAENKNFHPDHEKRFGRHSIRTFQANKNKGTFPVFETTIDLADSSRNQPGFAPKYERAEVLHSTEIVDPTVRRPGETLNAFLARLGEVAALAKSATESTLRSLDTMNVEQLKELAEQEEIDYETCRNADDFRKVIRTALAPPPATPTLSAPASPDPKNEGKSAPPATGKK